jgi:uncharacterized short protein YbdD (DUF466 family)
MKLQEIINTDCYVEFDSKVQLKKWSKKYKLGIYVSDYELYIRFFKDNRPHSAYSTDHSELPVYHHSTITI